MGYAAEGIAYTPLVHPAHGGRPYGLAAPASGLRLRPGGIMLRMASFLLFRLGTRTKRPNRKGCAQQPLGFMTNMVITYDIHFKVNRGEHKSHENIVSTLIPAGLHRCCRLFHTNGPGSGSTRNNGKTFLGQACRRARGAA
jgi:hypothetical protein